MAIDENKLIEEVEQGKVSEDTVMQCFDFARFAKSSYPNVFSPSMVNQRMKDVNMNPLEGNATDVSNALKDPKNNDDKLVTYSEFFEYTDMIYKRTLSYMALMPSFDVTYLPVNASVEDLSKSNYKTDEQRVVDFLYKLDIKEEFSKISKQLIRQETFYSVLREDGERYQFQELPMSYCKTTGRAEWGLLFDFDMNWFIQPSVDIDMYPSVFKEYYNDIYNKGSGLTKYKPSNDINKRNGTYVTYVQTSMEEGFWAFKFNDSQIGNVPYFSPMFNDLVLAPQIRELQTNKYIIEATKILIGLVPLLRDNKSGNVKDMMGISPETLGKFLGLLRGSINDVYSLGAVPFTDVKSIDFKPNAMNMQVDYKKNVASSSGTTSSLVYSYEKMNAIETNNSIAVDELIATQVYPQFERFLEYVINKTTKKYKFKFTLEGTRLPANKEKRLDVQMKLMDKGIVMHQKLAAAIGILPHELEMQMAMTKAKSFVDGLTPVLNSYNLSSKDTLGDSASSRGATAKSDSEITESGMKTRESGENIEKGGNL